MEPHWSCWMIFERNELLVNLMCFKIPQELDVRTIQRQALPLWQEYRVHAVSTATTWECYYYYLGWLLACDLGFYGILLNIWSESSVLEVNILWCTALWAVLGNICPIWGYCAFPHEWNFGKFIIKQWHWGETWTVAGFKTIATDPAWNGEWPIYTHLR